MLNDIRSTKPLPKAGCNPRCVVQNFSIAVDALAGLRTVAAKVQAGFTSMTRLSPAAWYAQLPS